jgi:hypothetical protein
MILVVSGNSLLNTEKLDQATPGIASHHKIEPEFQNEVNTT